MGKSKIIREVFNDVTPTGRRQRIYSDQTLNRIRESHSRKFHERHPDLIEEFREVHGDKYDYSLVKYVDSNTPLEIICPIHGVFLQKFYRHVSGSGCTLCGREKTLQANCLTTEKIIEQFKHVHGEIYDYSLVDYRGINNVVTIICRIHGEFAQNPRSHKNGSGCPVCTKQKVSKMKTLDRSTLIDQFRSIHGDKYDYSLVRYVRNDVPVTVICSKHGPFDQTPYVHKSGAGCPRCGVERVSKTKFISQDEVIRRFILVHGDKYDYSKVIYHRNDQKITIICPTHGEFEQTPGSHRSGAGCTKCYREKQKSKRESLNTVLQKFRSVHGDRYDYSKVVYQGSGTKVIIVCPIHGEFLQAPTSHVKGFGCRRCGFEQRAKTISQKKSL